MRLDGRVFEQLSLDVNVVGPQDPRPFELVRVQRNPFEFVGESQVEIHMVTPAQQLAEKLHAYTRLYEDESSSRAKDLFDMLVIASQVQLPGGAALTAAVRQTFRIRATEWPPELVEPPADWAKPWEGFIADYPLQWGSVSDGFVASQRFWVPILTGVAADADAFWQPDAWQWA